MQHVVGKRFYTGFSWPIRPLIALRKNYCWAFNSLYMFSEKGFYRGCSLPTCPLIALRKKYYWCSISLCSMPREKGFIEDFHYNKTLWWLWEELMLGVLTQCACSVNKDDSLGPVKSNINRWGLYKSMLIHRWRCDSSRVLKVAYWRCLQHHALLEVIIIDLLND